MSMKATEQSVIAMVLYCGAFAVISGLFLSENASILVVVPPLVVAYVIASAAAGFSAKGARRR